MESEVGLPPAGRTLNSSIFRVHAEYSEFSGVFTRGPGSWESLSAVTDQRLQDFRGGEPLAGDRTALELSQGLPNHFPGGAMPPSVTPSDPLHHIQREASSPLTAQILS